jgi:eukaryotic-like serine/threonine-protein kinase
MDDDGTELRVLGGRYRLVRRLDRGGMGSVWYAEHLVLQSPVAVKLLDFDAREGDRAERFSREARMAAALRSPHVVQILDYGVEGQTPYMVMELLTGESLAARLRRVTCLSPEETNVTIAQIARAIGRAHEAGIVHRDLKPANVFVVRDADVELVKVLDFGIAKAPPGGDANTQSGTFLGTPAYASPEQIQGLRALDHRSDIWSLGVIAFECLLGLRPFEGDTFGAVVVAVCSKPLPIPSSRGAVPAGFDAWFATACARDPDDRFGSARQAAEALSRVCAGEPSVILPLTRVRSGADLQPATVPDREESVGSTQRAASVASRRPHTVTRWRAASRLAWLIAALGAALGANALLRASPRPARPSEPAPSATAVGAIVPAAAEAPPVPSRLPTFRPDAGRSPSEDAAPVDPARSDSDATAMRGSRHDAERRPRAPLQQRQARPSVKSARPPPPPAPRARTPEVDLGL